MRYLQTEKLVFVYRICSPFESIGGLVRNLSVVVLIPLDAFCAIRCVADRDILQRICYDFVDKQLLNLLKPSLEEAFDFPSQRVCLDFIGKRGPTVGANREKRIQYAREV